MVSVADRDIKLRGDGGGGGGGSILFCLPSRPFFLLWFHLFSPKIRKAPPLDLPLYSIFIYRSSASQSQHQLPVNVKAVWPSGLGCWSWIPGDILVKILHPTYCHLDLFTKVLSLTPWPHCLGFLLVYVPFEFFFHSLPCRHLAQWC